MPAELRNTAAGISISGSPTMLLRGIILYEKSYSQFSRRCSTGSLKTRMFRVILAFGGGIKLRDRGRNWQRYSHDVHKLFANWNGHEPCWNESPESLTGNYRFGSDGDHIIMVALSSRIDERKNAIKKYHLIRSLKTTADWRRMSRSGKSRQKLLPTGIILKFPISFRSPRRYC